LDLGIVAITSKNVSHGLSYPMGIATLGEDEKGYVHQDIPAPSFENEIYDILQKPDGNGYKNGS
jgi:hypothetical protein